MKGDTFLLQKGIKQITFRISCSMWGTGFECQRFGSMSTFILQVFTLLHLGLNY